MAKTPAMAMKRCLAVMCAMLIVVLAVLAANPSWHEWLHHGQQTAMGDDGCAVTLFSNGVTGAESLAVLAVVFLFLRKAFGEPNLSPDIPGPRFRLLPGRAPPFPA